MTTTITLQAAGLNLSPNQLALPQGSLSVAENVIIRRDNVIEPRRGMSLYGDTIGTASDRAKQLFNYKDRILRHFQSTLQYDDGSGSFSSFSGDFSEVESGLRIKGIEANGNFYFTTSEGIKKISASSANDFTTASGYIVNAGGLKALDMQVFLNTTPSVGAPWFTADSTVAYRSVWGIKDNNDNLILGTASERATIYNPLLSLVLGDFLTVLGALDSINQVGSLITDGNYVDSLKLPAGTSASDLRINLIALADKIDNDIYLANSTGAGVPLTISTPAGTGLTITATTATITFSLGDPTLYISVGDTVELSGFVVTTGSVNGARVVTAVTSTTIEFTTDAVGPCTTLGDIYSGNYSAIAQPAIPSLVATHNEVAALQQYLGNIISRLQSELTGVISTPLQTAYIQSLLLTEAVTTNLEITVPSNATLNHFFQVYRSSVLTALGVDVLTDLVPSDELKLIYEANPTQSQLDSRIIAFEDITPEDFAGANLYTNPSSGEGILQSNDLPPLAKDITVFKDFTFYANTKTLHRAFLTLLGVQNLIDQYTGGDTPTLTIANENSFATYHFITGEIESTDLTCPAQASVPAAGYFTLNSANNLHLYYVRYDTTGSDVDPAISGRTGIKVDISALTTATEVAERTRDTIAIQVEDFNTSSVTSTVTITNTDEGYCDDIVLGPGMFAAGFSFTVTNQGIGEKFTQEVSSITTVADVAGSLAGTYFTLNNAYDIDRYYVWFKVSGVGADPLVANRTGLQVDIVTNDTAAAVASAIESTINTNISTIFSASVLSNVVTITNQRHGPSLAAAAGTSGFTATTIIEGTLEVLLSGNVSPAQAVDKTLRSLIRGINRNTSAVVNAFQLSSSEDIPGKFLLEAKNLSDIPFYALGDSTIIGTSFSPTVSPTLTITSIGTGFNPTITTTTNHGLSSGDIVIITNTDSVPNVDGVYIATVTGLTTFMIDLQVITAGTQGSLVASNDAEISTNEDKPNRIYYSKFQQPEAVPIANYLDVGPQDAEILRIVPLRDSLFVIKDDGVYRISGESAPFAKSLFDSTAHCISPDSIASVDNLIFAWLHDGIATISETGINTISKPIDVVTLKLSSANYPNFRSATFGVGYESDNAYLVWTVKDTTDTIAQKCFRYNTITDSWTTFNFGATCGLINSANETLYLGSSDTNKLLKERKLFSRTDYADKDYDETLQLGNYNTVAKTILLPSTTAYAAGDVVLQTQTVTIYDFNMLLKKLDTDTILSDTDYYSTLNVSAGVSLNAQLNILLTKLSADTGNAYYTSTILPMPGSTFTELQDKFNLMITTLNADVAVGWSNYLEIDNDTIMEMYVTSVNNFTKKLTLFQNLDFVVGAISIFKAIHTKVRWSPNLFGDAVSYKHIREATLMTDANAWTEMKLLFATDLLPELEEVVFRGDGNGAFGISNEFGGNFFGGTSNSSGMRTYVPRNKQRCRYMIIEIDHEIAREHFNVFGISLTGRTGISARAYR